MFVFGFLDDGAFEEMKFFFSFAYGIFCLLGLFGMLYVGFEYGDFLKGSRVHNVSQSH